jgi:heat shock protein HslJ
VRRTTASLAIAGTCALTIAACDENLVAPSSAAALAGSLWKLQVMQRPGGFTARAPDPGRFTLQLTDESRVSVLADCNRCSGNYAVTAGQLTIPGLACTRALCPSVPFDNDYVAVLTGDNAVAVGARALRLSSSRGTLTFVR